LKIFFVIIHKGAIKYTKPEACSWIQAYNIRLLKIRNNIISV